MAARTVDICMGNFAVSHEYTQGEWRNRNSQVNTPKLVLATGGITVDEYQAAPRNSWGVEPVQRLNARENADCVEKPSR